MTIIHKQRPRKIEIDLSGPQGNAYYLLGLASTLAGKIGLDKDSVLNEMRAGDYENLIQVFDKHFGSFVDLVIS